MVTGRGVYRTPGSGLRQAERDHTHDDEADPGHLAGRQPLVAVGRGRDVRIEIRGFEFNTDPATALRWMLRVKCE